MAKVAQIGAGLVGKAMALDLAKQHNVFLTDFDDEALKKSYWIKQYSPEVLGEEATSGHGPAASDTKEDLLVREAIDRIKRIEENLGIPKQ